MMRPVSSTKPTTRNTTATVTARGPEAVDVPFPPLSGRVSARGVDFFLPRQG